jgi:hypothetical protein
VTDIHNSPQQKPEQCNNMQMIAKEQCIQFFFLLLALVNLKADLWSFRAGLRGKEINHRMQFRRWRRKIIASDQRERERLAAGDA